MFCIWYREYLVFNGLRERREDFKKKKKNGVDNLFYVFSNIRMNILVESLEINQ